MMGDALKLCAKSVIGLSVFGAGAVFRHTGVVNTGLWYKKNGSAEVASRLCLELLLG